MTLRARVNRRTNRNDVSDWLQARIKERLLTPNLTPAECVTPPTGRAADLGAARGRGVSGGGGHMLGPLSEPEDMTDGGSWREECIYGSPASQENGQCCRNVFSLIWSHLKVINDFLLRVVDCASERLTKVGVTAAAGVSWSRVSRRPPHSSQLSVTARPGAGSLGKAD